MNASIQRVRMSLQVGLRVKVTRSHLILAVAVMILAVTCTALQAHTSSPETWEQRISRIVWVAYSPPTGNPNRGIEASPEAIGRDLAVLRNAGFTGLVTYSCSGVLGRELSSLAQSQGFEGLIMGIWDPSDQKEIAAAKAAAKSPILLGYCVGNEGLRRRYKIEALFAAIQDIRITTGKPVTTTEIIEEYSQEDLLRVGDWVFPNAHPYFHNLFEPYAAVRWTKGAYDDLKRRSNQFIIFKEVGLPTAGDSKGILSEESQERYYLELAKTEVRFVYFEAFDQSWKTHPPVEPHWGVFRSDRTPKRLARRLMEREQSRENNGDQLFYIYQDATSPNNHYQPTGFMGDTGDIHINEVFAKNPHSGKTSIQVVYNAKGKGPSQCDYPPPCRWAGVYWQEPPNNWGKDAFWSGKGFDLSGYIRLTFWARANKKRAIEFKVGGIDQPYGDSLLYPRSVVANLTTEWQEFEIDLKGANLKNIIGGFCFVTNWDMNPDGVTFYLDDIRFEKK